ncbi:Hint domain-containing protein [Thalassovita taeanensis]|uniref:Hint domain-containing protein n=1 Tax=Thalassovita taeanensis TaxID=657014 RepID=A0A1H9HRU1_9RHOB|nr:Hint domain-containing protein [Thalassovita taeanensis]SEQ65080.1 Hint domain-containing protein [Thalassovita taeanensis]
MKPNTVGRNDGQQPATRRNSTPEGLLAGTLILTQDGEFPVEALSAGDKIITRGAGFVALRNIHHHVLTCETVRIRAGTLGHTRPEGDVDLPVGQMILIRDWRAKAMFGQEQALVAAARLVDGAFLTLQPEARHSVFTLVFDTPQVIYASGLELASHHPALAVVR